MLQNVYAEEMVHQALPEAKVDQYESVDLMYQALNSGRADAAATDMSSLHWFMKQNPDRYLDAGYRLEPADLFLRGQARRPRLAELRQHRAARGDDRRRVRDLQRVLREMVRRGAAGAADRLPERAALGPSRRGGMAYTLNFGVIWSNVDRLLVRARCSAWRSPASRSSHRLASSGSPAPSRRRRRSRALRAAVAAYVTAVRNTPLLVIVLVVYFALPELGIRLGKIESFVVSLALYAGAYLTEVFRAGLIGVPRGADRRRPRDRARPPARSRLLVRLPIMLRNALPALGTTFISLFKDTSIAAAIAVPELTFQARRINVETFRVVEAWLAASVLYVATCLADRRRPAPARTPLPAVLRRRWTSSSPRSGSRGGSSPRASLATIEISAAAIVVGSAIGLGVGVGLVFGRRPLRWLLRVYVDLVRGTPVLVLILASFYILAVIGLQLGAPQAGHLRAVAVLRRASRRDPARRAAGDPVDPDRVRAQPRPGSCRRSSFLVLLPQALRQVLPVWVNTATEIVKASTLLSVIGVGELLLKTQEIIGRNFLTLEFYVLAGLRLLPDQPRHPGPRPARRAPLRIP